MNFIQQFFFGLRTYPRAFQFIFREKLYVYFIIPAVLMLGIYALGAHIQSLQPDEPLETYRDLIWTSIRVLIELSIALLLMKFAKYLVVVLLSPLLSHLSQRCEKKLKGTSYPFSFKQLWSDIKRSMRLVVRNLMWEYFFFVLIFLISSIGWKPASASPVFYLTYVIGFYYYGFSFLDYINERRKMDVDNSILFVRKHRGLAMSIGMIYSLLILVPVDLGVLFTFADGMHDGLASLGEFFLQVLLWLLAAIAPVWAIVTATICMYDLNGIEPVEGDIVYESAEKENEDE